MRLRGIKWSRVAQKERKFQKYASVYSVLSFPYLPASLDLPPGSLSAPAMLTILPILHHLN